MGLDGVEIVMKAEEAFDIVIEDHEAEKTLTPRDLIELVMSKVGRTDRAVCLTQRSFHRFRASMIRTAGFRREHIKPEGSVRALFPLKTRKESVRQVLQDIGLKDIPQFVRPSWLVYLSFGVAVGAGIFSTIFLSHLSAMPFGSSPFFFGCVFTALAGWLLAISTRGLRRDFQPAMTTVGDFCRWIVAHGPQVVNAPPGQWSREQVAVKVREIVIDVLGCEKNYREDAHFVKDLGLS